MTATVPSRIPVRRRAGVLIALVARRDGVRVVLVERAASGRHGGQLALPGGNEEPQDGGDLRETTLRETGEEIGLGRRHIGPLQALQPVDTTTTGYRVWPFMATVDPTASATPTSPEIASIVEIDLGRLLAPEARSISMRRFATWPEARPTPVRTVDDHEVWGLTLRILEAASPHLPGRSAGTAEPASGPSADPPERRDRR